MSKSYTPCLITFQDLITCHKKISDKISLVVHKMALGLREQERGDYCGFELLIKKYKI